MVTRVVAQIKDSVQDAQDVYNTLNAVWNLEKAVEDLSVSVTMIKLPDFSKQSIPKRQQEFLDTMAKCMKAKEEILLGYQAAQNLKKVFLDVEKKAGATNGGNSSDESSASSKMKEYFSTAMGSLQSFHSSTAVDSMEKVKGALSYVSRQLDSGIVRSRVDDICHNYVRSIVTKMEESSKLVDDTYKCVSDVVKKKWNLFNGIPDQQRKIKFSGPRSFESMKNSSKDQLYISKNSLDTLGWTSESGEDSGGISTDNQDSIVITKYSKPGYSNLSLKLMWNWCSEKGIFNDYPDKQFPVPEGLTNFYKGIRSQLRSKKRLFCVPKDQSGKKAYQDLRSKYLSLSFDMSFSLDGLVNFPSLVPSGEDLAITRQIYVGSQSSGTSGSGDRRPSAHKYLYDYNGTAVEIDMDSKGSQRTSGSSSTASRPYQEKNERLEVAQPAEYKFFNPDDYPDSYAPAKNGAQQNLQRPIPHPKPAYLRANPVDSKGPSTPGSLQPQVKPGVKPQNLWPGAQTTSTPAGQGSSQLQVTPGVKPRNARPLPSTTSTSAGQGPSQSQVTPGLKPRNVRPLPSTTSTSAGQGPSQSQVTPGVKPRNVRPRPQTGTGTGTSAPWTSQNNKK